MESEGIKEKTGKPKTSKLAIASLALAFVGLLLCSLSIRELEIIYACWLIWVVAFACGRSYLTSAKKIKSPLWARRIAFTGCLLAVLFALGMTFMIHDIHLISASYCRSNIRFLGNGIRAYCAKNDGKFPEPSNWCDLVISEANSVWGLSEETLRCPKVPNGKSGYAFNKNLAGLRISEVDPNTVLLFEAEPGWNQNGGPEMMTVKRHQLLFTRKYSYVVCVGTDKVRIKAVKNRQQKKLRWNP